MVDGHEPGKDRKMIEPDELAKLLTDASEICKKNGSMSAAFEFLSIVNDFGSALKDYTVKYGERKDPFKLLIKPLEGDDNG